jgi:hypothetical protein
MERHDEILRSAIEHHAVTLSLQRLGVLGTR